MTMKFFLVIACLLLGSGVCAQLRIDDVNYSVEELVRDVLISSNCAETSNYSSFTGTSQGINGIGYFNAENTDFVYKEGIILSTGSARDARKVGGEINNSGTEIWPGDDDLRKITNTPNLFNASYIEFDFVPITNQISFNFLFASEEYVSDFQCIYSDVFAFILTNANGVSTNLALIPGTTEPVRVTSIRPGVENICSANNLEFFGQINGIEDAVAFEGQTASLTAKSDVTPGETYTIKLVVSDNRDSELDSAVFLEAGSFNLGYDLGEDRTVVSGYPVCIGDTLVLNAEIEGAINYKWYRDDVLVSELEGSAEVAITQSGSYDLEIIFAETCVSEGKLAVEFIERPKFSAAVDNETACDIDGDGVEVFDLTKKTIEILGDQDPDIYQVTYYLTQADARSLLNPIENPKAYEVSTEETLYVRVSSGRSCYEIESFKVKVQALAFTSDLALEYALCLNKEGKILNPLPVLDTGLSNATYTFSWYKETTDAANKIENANDSSYTASEPGFYLVLLQNLEFGCEFSIATQVTTVQEPESVKVEFITDLFVDANTVDILATGNSTYLFAVDNRDFTASNRFENLSAGEHTAYITDSANCSVRSQTFLVVDYPRFFTPNGDGINDVWQIVGVDNIDDVEISIFNQFGALLHKQDQNTGWDGTVGGQMLPASDYWFRINYSLAGNNKEFKGHFSLKR